MDENVLVLHKPILGICLVMQMLGKGSEEGRNPGLGYIDFVCKRFSFSACDLKIPHMGWDYVNIENPDSCMAHEIGERPRFYFVHSYYALPDDPAAVAARCTYMIEFAAALSKGKIFAAQFHPEKSQDCG